MARELGARKQQAISSTVGAVLQITDVVGNLQYKAMQSRIRQETIEGKTAYQQYMDQMMIDNSKSGDLEVLAKWPDKAREESKKFMASFTGEKKYTEATKNEMALWSKDQENSYYKEAALSSMKRIGENERKALPATLEFFANDDDKMGFMDYLTDMQEQLLPAEKDIQLSLFDQKVAISDVDRILDVGDYEYARRFIDQSLGHIEDSSFKEMLVQHVDATEAAESRKNATVMRLKQEQVYSTLLADQWDGVLASPQVITDAVRQGLITPEAARTLKSEMLTKSRPTESNPEDMAAVEEALLDLRDGVGGVGDVLDTITIHSGGLSSTDGRAYVKEAFATKVSADSEWDKLAHADIKDMILDVSTMTGILYGSAEQKAMVSQAIVKYAEAKRSARADGKILSGPELLKLAREIVIPFRSRLKPLVKGGEKIPEIELTKRKERISGHAFGIDRVALGMAHDKPQSSQKPKTKEEFESNFRSIADQSARKAYYEKWASEVYK
jgi:polyhydroxyalkanoate synthesis regulator phasin